MTNLIVVMGVSGSGKTVVGTHLAQQLGIDFVDGDQLHSEASVERMRAGIPMNDETRKPWLAAICQRAEASFANQRSLAIACSALKTQYRSFLRTVSRPVLFVYLKGDSEVIQQRLNRRTGHYMPGSLLASQFGDLEDPSNEPGVITVNVDQSIESMLREAVHKTNRYLENISIPDEDANQG